MENESATALSIVIVSWNGEAVIGRCLRSIYNRTYTFSFEVIVVDNGSKDGTVGLIKEEFPGVILVEEKNNLGYALGNNRGIALARGKYILLLNQDVELIGSAIEDMYRYLNEHESEYVGVVAPMLEYPDGRLQLSVRRFPTPLNVLMDMLSLGTWHARQYDHKKSQFVDQPMASCLMINGKLLRDLGGFDTDSHFFLYFNDVDLSYRIHQKGFKHYYMADIKTLHHHGQGARQWVEARRLKAWTDGLYYFLVKHYSKKQVLPRLLLWLLVGAIFWARAAVETAKAAMHKYRMQTQKR